MTKNKLWSKLAKNGRVFTKQSLKNDLNNFFFLNPKMLGICGFHNKFSILGPSDLIGCVPDGPEPHGNEIASRAP